uniref:PB1 domain-containing protein n=1 Tax=Rhizophora mucronata TaxID=61149 RepID=A0A2P2N0R2_RHIMU
MIILCVGKAELMMKLGELCGYFVELRCQLPGGDLETLVSVKSDEELAFLFEEYDQSCRGSKIRAVLFPVKLLKTISPPSSTASDFDLRLGRSWSPPTGSPLRARRINAELRCYPRRGQGNPRFLLPEHCCCRNYHY